MATPKTSHQPRDPSSRSASCPPLSYFQQHPGNVAQKCSQGPNNRPARMRPDLLPPLRIPQKQSPKPVLVGKYRCPARPERKVLGHKPSNSHSTFKPLPPLPPFRKSHRLVDFDDIDVFKFYNPCVLPPSPVIVPTKPAAEPAELPGSFPKPPPDIDGSSAGDREIQERTPRGEHAQQSRGQAEPKDETIRHRDESTVISRVSSLSSTQTVVEAPPPPEPPERRRPPLINWDARSSFYSTDENLTNEHSRAIDNRRGNSNAPIQRQEDLLTPRLNAEPSSNFQTTDPEMENTALRELIGIIDELLDPGPNRFDTNDRSQRLSVGTLGTTLDYYFLPREMLNVETTHSCNNTPGSGGKHTPQGTTMTWWKALRQGLLI
jgi:hypothetical protein